MILWHVQKHLCLFQHHSCPVFFRRFQFGSGSWFFLSYFWIFSNKIGFKVYFCVCVSSWSNTIFRIDFSFPRQIALVHMSKINWWYMSESSSGCLNSVPLINLSTFMVIKCYLYHCFFTVICEINLSAKFSHS